MIPEQERCYNCFIAGNGYELNCANYLRTQAVRKEPVGVECVWSRTIRADVIKLLASQTRNGEGAFLTFPEIALKIVEESLEDVVSKDNLGGK